MLEETRNQVGKNDENVPSCSSNSCKNHTHNPPILRDEVHKWENSKSSKKSKISCYIY